MSVIEALFIFVKNYFFGFIFGASWYFGALIVGMPLVCLMLKLLTCRFLWVPALLMHIYLFNTDRDAGLYAWYATNVHLPTLSFPNALVWLTMGYYLSGGRVLDRFRTMSGWWLVGVMALYLLLGTLFPHLRYVLLLVAVPVLVLGAYYWCCGLGEGLCRRVRIFSTHLFCLHTSVLGGLIGLGVAGAGVRYVVCCAICAGVSWGMVELGWKVRWVRGSWGERCYGEDR